MVLQVSRESVFVGVGYRYVGFPEHDAVAPISRTFDMLTMKERCTRMNCPAGRCCSMVFIFISDIMQVGESSV